MRVGGGCLAGGLTAMFTAHAPTARAEQSGRWGGVDWTTVDSGAKKMEGLAVRPENLEKLVVKILLAAGSSQQEADTVAGNLVESNLKGHDSHGVGYLTRYIPGIQSKLLKVNQHASVISDRGCFLLVDGHLGFGQVIGKEATELAIAKCKEHGVAVVGVRSTSSNQLCLPMRHSDILPWLLARYKLQNFCLSYGHSCDSEICQCACIDLACSY